MAHRHADVLLVAACRQSIACHWTLLGYCSPVQWVMGQLIHEVTIGVAPLKARLPVAIIVSDRRSWGIGR